MEVPTIHNLSRFDSDSFADLSDLERHILAAHHIYRDSDAAPRQRAKASDVDGKIISSGRQVGEGVAADIVG